VKILLADDHALFREGIRLVLLRLGPDTTVLEADNYNALLELASRHGDADLALVDLDMPGVEPFEALQEVLSRFPTLPLVVLTASENPQHMRRVFDLGAMGYIPKKESSDVMLSAIHLVTAGGVYIPRLMMKLASAPAPSNTRTTNARATTGLTPRQLDVLGKLVCGKSNKEIGRELGLTEATVKTHIAAIFRSLGVANRTQAVLVAEKMGLVNPEG
jgi:DNA-binding NarL/FixJ family response regulator